MATTQQVLAHSPLFSALDPGARAGLAGMLKLKKLAPGEALFREGDQGDSLGVVASGELSVRCADAAGGEVEVARLGPGEVVGEMACLDPAPRSASLIALSETVVGTLDRSVLASMRAHAPALAVGVVDAVARVLTTRLRETNEQIRVGTEGARPRTRPVTRRSPAAGAPYGKPLNLRGVPALSGYDDAELATLAEVAPPLVYQDGEVLCWEGGRADACYLIAGGEVDIVRHLEAGPQVLATLGRGAMVGQLALLDDAPRSATVRAKGTTGVLAIRRGDFRRLLDAHDTLALKLHEQVTAAGIRQLRLADKHITRILAARRRDAAPARSARPPTRPPSRPVSPTPAGGRPTTAEKAPHWRELLKEGGERRSERGAPPARPTSKPLSKAAARAAKAEKWRSGESRPPPKDAKVLKGEQLLSGGYLGAALGEWGLSLDDLDSVAVVRPQGQMSQAELKARLER